jgi:hypothetical protein
VTHRAGDFPRENSGHFEFVARKSVETMEVKQRSVINFCSDEDMPQLEIVQRLKEQYEEGVLFRSQVYYWIRQVKLWRTGLVLTSR